MTTITIPPATAHITATIVDAAHTAEIERLTEANRRLTEELHDARNQAQIAIAHNGLLRHTLRQLGYRVQELLPHLSALVESRNGLADAWANADKLMRETTR